MSVIVRRRGRGAVSRQEDRLAQGSKAGLLAAKALYRSFRH